MDMNIVYLWLLVGVVFIAIEAVGISGVGFLFAGLGALVTGTALHMEWIEIDDRILQFTVFFIATFVWAALLWKPMQKIMQRKQGGYSNIVGDTAYVGSGGLHKHRGGEVTWSGTIMRAQLDNSASVESLEPGAQVVIVETKGATLVVKPK